MRFINFRFIFSLVMLMLLFSAPLAAQELQGSQGDYVKKQVRYNRWRDILREKPEVRYDEFKLDDAMVSPWSIQRVQQIEAANRGSMVQYVLAKTDEVGQAQEILVVSVTRCSTRAVAAEGLIDHLLGVERPDFRLVEEDALIVGDLAVNIPGDPEAAIFFLRGNILISVENAGEKAASNLRDLAQELDERLKERRKK